MLSGNKLKNDYAFSMAVEEGWLSWDVSEDWVSEQLTGHGLYFLWPKMAYPQELSQCVKEIHDLKEFFFMSVSVGYFLGEQRGLPCSITETGVPPKYHTTCSSGCWMEVSNAAKMVFSSSSHLSLSKT